MLALILLISVIYILVRKVLIGGLKGSDSGIINIILIVLGLIGIGCALSAALGISRINGLIEALNADKNISADKIALLQKKISDT